MYRSVPAVPKAVAPRYGHSAAEKPRGGTYPWPVVDFSERFALEGQIGSGGMASVWRARDRVLERTVAVKRLHPHVAADPESAARFEREALLAASLSHPGVVTVYDAGRDEQGPYIVMEHVEGETLADLIRREHRVDPDRAASIAFRVADALEHAHRQGLVHRDVKPGNILLDSSGTPRLTDFGIAKSVQGDRLTRNGTVMGTAAYLAPEQAAGGEAAAASDIYGLGVVLYEMLTGEVPFQAETPVAVALAHQTSPPRPPGALAPVPAGLEQIVLKALAKDPVDRYASAGALSERLRGWHDHAVAAPASPDPGNESATAPMRAPDHVPRPDPTELMTPPAAAEQPSPARSDRSARPWLALGGGLLAVAILVALIGGGWGTPFANGDAEPSSPTTLAPPATQVDTTQPATTPPPPEPTTTVEITVETAFAQLQDLLQEAVDSGELDRPRFNSLSRLAERALREWRRGDLEDAAEELADLDEEALKEFEEGRITLELLDSLLEQTDLIRQLADLPEVDDD